MRFWPTTTLLVALVALSLLPTTGEAQDPSGERGDDDGQALSPEDPRAAAEARERFQAGMTNFEERRFREAIHDFELAASLVPSADIWFNVARSYEELGEFEPAVQFYRRYLRDRVDPPDREAVETHITDLEARVEQARQQGRQAPTTGTLRIHSNVEGATVTVDGREIGETPISVPMSLEPGEHTVTVEQEGALPFRSQVDVEAGITTTAYADLREATEYRAVRGTRIFTWVAAGLAGVSLGTSIGYAVAAQSKNDEWQEMGSVPGDAALDDARRLARNSDILLGVGIGLAVTAVILYFIEGRAVDTERVSGQEVAVLRF